MFQLLQTTFIQSGLKWRDSAPQACTRTILYHSHAWENEDDEVYKCTTLEMQLMVKIVK